jgi:hypothetical protein
MKRKLSGAGGVCAEAVRIGSSDSEVDPEGAEITEQTYSLEGEVRRA